MLKDVETLERENRILEAVLDSYIEKTKPISSGYICQKYNLPYSSATVRHIMEILEEKGYLSHLHTSSGRVPTQKGFRRYAENIKKEAIEKSCNVNFLSCVENSGDVFGYTLDILAQISGCISLAAVSGKNSKFIFRGIRFMLEQPEFEDIIRLKHLLYAMEVKINKLQDLMSCYGGEQVKILVGDDMGFDEIADCSLLVSGAKEKDVSFSLGILGPMRMDYVKAASCLYSMKNQLARFIENGE